MRGSDRARKNETSPDVSSDLRLSHFMFKWRRETRPPRVPHETSVSCRSPFKSPSRLARRTRAIATGQAKRVDLSRERSSCDACMHACEKDDDDDDRLEFPKDDLDDLDLHPTTHTVLVFPPSTRLLSRLFNRPTHSPFRLSSSGVLNSVSSSPTRRDDPIPALRRPTSTSPPPSVLGRARGACRNPHQTHQHK